MVGVWVRQTAAGREYLRQTARGKTPNKNVINVFLFIIVQMTPQLYFLL